MIAADAISGELIDFLRTSSKVAVLTGAGISAESGVPTFRGTQTGLWAKYDPLQLATTEAFRNDPKLVWDWYTWRRELIASAHPNPGHYALVDLESNYPEFTLITQNVDGLHQLAGSKEVIELHGNIFRTKCAADGSLNSEPLDLSQTPPLCPDCGSYLRPDVVWFGEDLPARALAHAIRATNSCEIFLSIDTSTLVEPSASLPFIALENGATVIEINPQATPLTSKANHSICGNAGDVLPILAAQVLKP
jgi:NAD-dependent deacetylase